MTLLRTKPFAKLAEGAKTDPQRRARIEQYKRAIDDALTLAELRAQKGVTQQEIAAALDVTQANVSRIEREENLYLSTLRDYVEALGGQLEIRAVFPDQTVTLDAPHSR